MKELWQQIKSLGWKKRGEIKKKEKHEAIEYKFSVKKKGLNIVLQELKKEYMLRPSKWKSMTKEVNIKIH